MRGLRSLTVAAALTVLSTQAIAADGEEFYADYCSACHGEVAEGNPDLMAPVLAGYTASYTLRQMDHFVTGRRTGEDEMGLIEGMVDILGDLGEGEKTAIADYLAALDIPALEQQFRPAGFRERGLYSGCSSCHEADGAGNEQLGAPRLTGQYKWYIEAQLTGFRAGHRGTDPDDRFGRQMKAMADAIGSDADIELLSNYLLAVGAK